MKSLTIWLALLMNWMPFVFAYRVSNSVKKASSTCVMSTTTPPRTLLNYRDNLAGSADMEQKIEAKYYLKKSSKSHKGVNLGLIQSIVMTQAASLITCIFFSMIALTYSGHDVNSIRWDGSTHYGFLFPTESMAWLLIVAQGILAAAPMIYIGNFIESSERRNMANVHFSTITLVMNLFGRRERGNMSSRERLTNSIGEAETSIKDAMLAGTLVSVFSGISEEVIFRGMISSGVYYLSHSVLIALTLQAALFGVVHHSPSAPKGENEVMVLHQSLLGFWLGIVLILSGGNLIPSMIAHTLYDQHVLMETWMRANDQADYVEIAVNHRIEDKELNEIRKIKHEVGSRLSVEKLAFFRRLFYTFDKNHAESLSKSDVQRAISYLFLHDTLQPTQGVVSELFDRLILKRKEMYESKETSNRLSLPEFLNLILCIQTHHT